MSVKLAAILQFIDLNLDMYVAIRTAPHQSYRNPTERCMATPNYALQSVSLARKKMQPQYEVQAHTLTTLTALRKAASHDPGFKTAYQESMQDVLALLTDRFLVDCNIVGSLWKPLWATWMK